MPDELTVVEICAGAGGQSLGLEIAGFGHSAAVEIDSDACATLLENRPHWNVIEGDVKSFSGRPYEGADLLAGGVPCPPFSIAGKQLGHLDERDLFPQALRLVAEIQPKAVLLENVKGFAAEKFSGYRKALQTELLDLGYESSWRVLNASDFGVPQLRPRFVLVALQKRFADGFAWPDPGLPPVSVGQELLDLMASRGWPGATRWAATANGIAPTIVGGSKKHGGPDLGPSRARAEWERLRVNATTVAEQAPDPDFPLDGMPRLTLRMVARLQGFPDSWSFTGRKTTAYRQIGNAFPPAVAAAVAMQIVNALALPEKSDMTQLRLADMQPV